MDFPNELNLNLFPAISDNLLNLNNNPSQSFDLFGMNHHYYNDKMDFDEKLSESNNLALYPFSADVNKVEESGIKDKIDVDEFIEIFQKQLKVPFNNKEYDKIIEIIEKRFYGFFNEKTNGLLYIIQKLKFFELLRQDKITEAKQFYKENLLLLIKEIKKDVWEKKAKFFINLINKPKLILKQGNLQKKYLDTFNYELEKAIRNYYHEESEPEPEAEPEDNNLINDLLFSDSNNGLNHFMSSSSIDLIDPLFKINSNNEINTSNNKTKEISNSIDFENNNEYGKDDLDLENCSTKEEFSDFEDEICQKCVDNPEQKEENMKNNININDIEEDINNEDKFNDDFIEYKLDPVHDNKPVKQILSKNIKKEKELEENDKYDENIIDTSSKKIKKIINKVIINEKENNIYDKPKKKDNKNKNNKKQKNNKEQTIFNQLPLLNSFKPKYIKRETIDKKIIRNFKNYVVKENKEKRLEINEKTMDYHFFVNLINGNLLPPLNFHDINTDEYIKFNSFNCCFLLWFFSKKGVKEIYNQFINEKGKEFINDISEYYEISNEEKNQLDTYIMNFPNIFDISLVNNIAQGIEIKHIYRTVEKNKRINERKRKETDLDLKRLKSGENQRERSRSRDFDNND